MSRRIFTVITHLELHALPPPGKFEAAEETEARKAKLKPEALATLAELSPSQLFSAFKAKTQMTPGQYVKKLRLDHACELLVNPTLQITEIAYQSDYADVYHFSRDFKLDRKLSPREYRRWRLKNKLS